MSIYQGSTSDLRYMSEISALFMLGKTFWGGNNWALTVGSKIIRALPIILGIFLWFDCQFLSYHVCFKQYKALISNILFIKLR